MYSIPAVVPSGLTLIPAWISNYTRYKVWDIITYRFPNFKGGGLVIQGGSFIIAYFKLAHPRTGLCVTKVMSLGNAILRIYDML